MRFQNLLLGLLPQLLALPALAQCSTAALEPLAPALTYLFTTHVNVGKALAPITVMDGLEIGLSFISPDSSLLPSYALPIPKSQISEMMIC